MTVGCYNNVMEISFNAVFVVLLLLPLVVGLIAGFLIGRSSSQQLGDDRYPELLASNRVLEEKLANQQSQYEAQLKMLQDAKELLSKEFENLANRIFEDKQAKF